MVSSFRLEGILLTNASTRPSGLRPPGQDSLECNRAQTGRGRIAARGDQESSTSRSRHLRARRAGRPRAAARIGDVEPCRSTCDRHPQTLRSPPSRVNVRRSTMASSPSFIWRGHTARRQEENRATSGRARNPSRCRRTSARNRGSSIRSLPRDRQGAQDERESAVRRRTRGTLRQTRKETRLSRQSLKKSRDERPCWRTSSPAAARCCGTTLNRYSDRTKQQHKCIDDHDDSHERERVEEPGRHASFVGASSSARRLSAWNV